MLTECSNRSESSYDRGRALVSGVAISLMTTHAQAAPTTLTGDVDYDFIDKNGSAGRRSPAA